NWQLVPPFETAFQCQMAAWRMDGKPRTTRRFPVDNNYPLPHGPGPAARHLRGLRDHRGHAAGGGASSHKSPRAAPSPACYGAWQRRDSQRSTRSPRLRERPWRRAVCRSQRRLTASATGVEGAMIPGALEKTEEETGARLRAVTGSIGAGHTVALDASGVVGG